MAGRLYRSRVFHTLDMGADGAYTISVYEDGRMRRPFFTVRRDVDGSSRVRRYSTLKRAIRAADRGEFQASWLTYEPTMPTQDGER